MKNLLYITALGFLGLLVSTLLHGVIELVALDLIFGNTANAESFWWREWALVHRVGGGALWIGGLLAGLYAGFHWFDTYGSKPGAFGWGRK